MQSARRVRRILFEDMGVCGAYCAMYGRLRKVVVCLDTVCVSGTVYAFQPICSIVHGKSRLFLSIWESRARFGAKIISESHAHELTNCPGMSHALLSTLTRTAEDVTELYNTARTVI